MPTITGDGPLAVLYGVTDQTIADWRRSGLPAEKVGRQWQYDTDRTDPWVAAHRQPDAKKSDKITAAKELTAISKAQQEALRAKKLQREDAVALGNILPRDEWELFAIEAIQKTRDRFLRLGKTACKHVPKKYHRVLQAELDREVRSICEEMARDFARGPTD